MKILLFGNSTWCLYNFRAGLITSLRSRGCEVIALAPTDPTYDNQEIIKNIEDLGARFIEVPLLARSKNPLTEISSIFKILKIIKEIRPNVVLTFTIKCNLYTGLCRKFYPCRQIANVPGLGEVFSKRDWAYKIVCLLYKIAFKDMAGAFFQNREDLNFCAENALIDPKIGKLIPGSGVNLKNFVPQVSKNSDEPIVFLMFGRLLPQKGYYKFLDAARHLTAKYPKKVEFWVLGIEDKNRPQSGMLLNKIKEFARLGVIKHFESLVDVRPILSKADVVCLPSSYNEGIPRSLLEAMAEGKAIITTDWKGCRETVDPGVNGVLVEPGSQSSLETAIEDMIALGHDEIFEMGLNSRRIVEERFDEDLVIQAYLSEIFPEYSFNEKAAHSDSIEIPSSIPAYSNDIEISKNMVG